MISQMWAEEIIQALHGLPPIYEFTDSGFKPKGHERKMPKAVRAAIDEAKANKGQP